VLAVGEDHDDADFGYGPVHATAGSYDPETGIRSVGSLAPGESATLAPALRDGFDSRPSSPPRPVSPTITLN
jgi:hypothetical protein